MLAQEIERLLAVVSGLLVDALGGEADLAARTLDPPSEVPIGVIMGSLGGPFFLWMIYRSRRFGISAP